MEMGELFHDLSVDPFSVPSQTAAFFGKLQKNIGECKNPGWLRKILLVQKSRGKKVFLSNTV